MSYQIAVFEFHKLFDALVFVNGVVVGKNALAVDGRLEVLMSLRLHEDRQTFDAPQQSISRLLGQTAELVGLLVALYYYFRQLPRVYRESEDR